MNGTGRLQYVFVGNGADFVPMVRNHFSGPERKRTV